jgi:hypothetical protein
MRWWIFTISRRSSVGARSIAGFDRARSLPRPGAKDRSLHGAGEPARRGVGVAAGARGQATRLSGGDQLCVLLSGVLDQDVRVHVFLRFCRIEVLAEEDSGRPPFIPIRSGV